MTRSRTLRDLGGLRLLAGYYLATPVFALADLLGWAPVRVAALAETDWRFAYYAGAFALGLVARRWPGSAPFVGLVEGSVNLTLLLLSVLLPIWGLVDDPFGAQRVGAALPGRVANLALVGSVTVLSLTLTLRRLADPARTRLPS